MKVEGPRGPQQTGKTSKSGSASSTDASMFRGLMASEDVAESAPATTTQQIAALDVLLAVQGVEDPTEKAARKRATVRSDDLLKGLERIRAGMLAGTLTVGHMIDIADVVATHRERIRDPELTTLLDEIDLRAQVELAKMRRALDDIAGPGTI